jgi:hypothetical protein
LVAGRRAWNEGSLKRGDPSRKRPKEPSAHRLATAPTRDRRRVGHNAGLATAEIVGADTAAPYPSSGRAAPRPICLPRRLKSPESRAPQACPSPRSARFPGTPRLLRPFTKATSPAHQGYCARPPRLLRPHTKATVPAHQGYFARTPRLLCPHTKATASAHQGYCARSPRLLCPFTKATVPVHQGYCARSPRLLCPFTKATVPVHQGYCARSPRLLCPLTKATVLVHQGYCTRSPRLLCPFTKLGPRVNPPDSRAHQDEPTHESSRIMDTCTPLCPQIRPNHGHLHPTVPANPPESRAHRPHCARESSRSAGPFAGLMTKTARSTLFSGPIPGQTSPAPGTSRTSQADLCQDAGLPHSFGVPCVLLRPRTLASPPPKPRLTRRIGAIGSRCRSLTGPSSARLQSISRQATTGSCSLNGRDQRPSAHLAIS